MEPTNYICLSYVPLLYGDPNQLHPRKEEKPFPAEMMKKIREGEKLGHADACLWCRYKEQFAPVFALKRAKEIREHLVAWSEGKPQEWFKIYFPRQKDRYGVVLMPVLSKSIDRFKLVQLHVHETILTDQDKITILFKPLQFLSNKQGMIDKIQLTNSHYLGFLDVKDLNREKPELSPEPEFIGPFEVGNLEEFKGFLDNLLK